MEPKVIVFQGDSITDCGRDISAKTHNGRGYAHLVAAHLTAEEPMVYSCINRGISGNRIVDLYARIKIDMINLKPDYMSILIGINDVGQECASHNGVDAQKFEMVYSLLVEELQQALPNLKIMIMEPFVLHGSATNSTEEFPGRWEYFELECALRSAAAKRVAEKYALPFIPLQDLLDRVSADTPEGYWLSDGVHPSPAGHELIKREWLKAFETIK